MEEEYHKQKDQVVAGQDAAAAEAIESTKAMEPGRANGPAGFYSCVYVSNSLLELGRFGSFRRLSNDPKQVSSETPTRSAPTNPTNQHSFFRGSKIEGNQDLKPRQNSRNYFLSAQSHLVMLLFSDVIRAYNLYMHLLWLISLLILFIVCSALVWVYFCFAKGADAEVDLEFPDTIHQSITDSDSLTKHVQRGDYNISMPFPRFVQNYALLSQKKQKEVISTGLKHLRAVNKQIEKQEYFVSVAMLEKYRRLRKSIRRRKGKGSRLPPIYENAVYFEDQ